MFVTVHPYPFLLRSHSRFECLFNRPDIDGWDIRQGMNDLFGLDAVPDPRIINAALCACRRVDDYALTVRFLEGVIDKCGPLRKEIMPYIMQECGPTMNTLGCDWPECLGFHVPELWLEEVDEGMGRW